MKILIIDDDYILKALAMGAMGYLLKQDFESIVSALKAVNTGQNIFGDELVLCILKMLPNSFSVKVPSGTTIVRSLKSYNYVTEHNLPSFVISILDKS